MELRSPVLAGRLLTAEPPGITFVGEVQIIFIMKKTNEKDITETDDIKKRWQEYIEGYTENVLMNQITLMVWSFI